MAVVATCCAGLCDFSSVWLRRVVLGVLGALSIFLRSGWRRFEVGVPAAEDVRLLGLESSSKVMPAFWARVSKHLSGLCGSSRMFDVSFKGDGAVGGAGGDSGPGSEAASVSALWSKESKIEEKNK